MAISDEDGATAETEADALAGRHLLTSSARRRLAEIPHQGLIQGSPVVRTIPSRRQLHQHPIHSLRRQIKKRLERRHKTIEASGRRFTEVRVRDFFKKNMAEALSFIKIGKVHTY
jgi:hypothetical protein